MELSWACFVIVWTYGWDIVGGRLRNEEKEIKYGGELANLLGNVSCEDEFSPEQIRIIQDLVLQVVGHDHMQCCDYLTHKVHIMNLYKPKKENRFTYLIKMIKNDIVS